jgi:hypothetical protein
MGRDFGSLIQGETLDNGAEIDRLLRGVEPRTVD